MQFFRKLSLGLFGLSFLTSSAAMGLEVGKFTLKQDLTQKTLHFAIETSTVISQFRGAVSVAVERSSFQNFKQTTLIFKDSQGKTVAKAHQKFFTFSNQILLEDSKKNEIGQIIEKKQSSGLGLYLSMLDQNGIETFRAYPSPSISGQSKFNLKKQELPQSKKNSIQLDAIARGQGIVWTTKVLEQSEVDPLMIVALAVLETQNRIIQYYMKRVGYLAGTAIVLYGTYKIIGHYQAKKAARLLEEEAIKNRPLTEREKRRIAQAEERKKSEPMRAANRAQQKKQREDLKRFAPRLDTLFKDTKYSQNGGEKWVNSVKDELGTFENQLAALSSVEEVQKPALQEKVKDQISFLNAAINKTRAEVIDWAYLGFSRPQWMTEMLDENFPLLDTEDYSANQSIVATLNEKLDQMNGNLDPSRDYGRTDLFSSLIRKYRPNSY